MFTSDRVMPGATTILPEDARAPGTILIVDDSDELRDAMADVCTSKGHRVATACNGLEAIHLIEDGCRPCLVLLDLRMPVMSGLEVLAWLSQNEAWTGHVPVVVISGDAKTQNRAVMAYALEGLLEKPVDVDVLSALVATHCGPDGRPCSESVPGESR